MKDFSLPHLLRSRRFHLLIGSLVSVALLAWMAATVEWGSVVERITTMRWWPFIPATAVLFLHYTLRAYRWTFLLPSGESVTLRRSFNALMIGNFATYLLPLRAGEFIRPYVLSRNSSHTFAICFVSVVLERFFDLAAVLITFGLFASSLPSELLPAWAFHGAISLALVGGGIFVGIILAVIFPTQIRSVTSWGCGLFPPAIGGKLRKITDDLIAGAAVLASPRTTLVVVFLTIAVWTTGFTIFYLWLSLFEVASSLQFGIGVGVIVALAVAAPSLPGFIGVYQAACIATFAMFGADRGAGAAYSIVTHFHQYLFITGCGLFALHRAHLHVADLTAELQKRAA